MHYCASRRAGPLPWLEHLREWVHASTRQHSGSVSGGVGVGESAPRTRVWEELTMLPVDGSTGWWGQSCPGGSRLTSSATMKPRSRAWS